MYLGITEVGKDIVPTFIYRKGKIYAYRQVKREEYCFTPELPTSLTFIGNYNRVELLRTEGNFILTVSKLREFTSYTYVGISEVEVINALFGGIPKPVRKAKLMVPLKSLNDIIRISNDLIRSSYRI